MYFSPCFLGSPRSQCWQGRLLARLLLVACRRYLMLCTLSCIHGACMEGRHSGVSLIRALIPQRLPPLLLYLTLVTSQRLHCQIPSHYWGLRGRVGLQLMNCHDGEEGEDLQPTTLLLPLVTTNLIPFPVSFVHLFLESSYEITQDLCFSV